MTPDHQHPLGVVKHHHSHRRRQPHYYRPLEIDSTKGGIVFSTYEYLPATPANDALLAVTTAHPGATVVTATGNR